MTLDSRLARIEAKVPRNDRARRVFTVLSGGASDAEVALFLAGLGFELDDRNDLIVHRSLIGVGLDGEPVATGEPITLAWANVDYRGPMPARSVTIEIGGK